jgi:hypothetical protein
MYRHIYICTYICVYINVHIHILMYAYMYIYIYIYMYAYIYIYPPTNMCLYIYIHMHLPSLTFSLYIICTYIYIYMKLYINRCTLILFLAPSSFLVAVIPACSTAHTAIEMDCAAKLKSVLSQKADMQLRTRVLVSGTRVLTLSTRLQCFLDSRKGKGASMKEGCYNTGKGC